MAKIVNKHYVVIKYENQQANTKNDVQEFLELKNNIKNNTNKIE